jgi:hypothetical protein
MMGSTRINVENNCGALYAAKAVVPPPRLCPIETKVRDANPDFFLSVEIDEGRIAKCNGHSLPAEGFSGR